MRSSHGLKGCGALLVCLLVSSCQLEIAGSGDGPRDGGQPDASLEASAGSGGGAGMGAGGSAGQRADAAADAQPVFGYQYRRRISLGIPGGYLPKGYTVTVSFDHEQLTINGKARFDGQDVRVYHESNASRVQLDRALDEGSAWKRADTRVAFATDQDITAAEFGEYYLYYGYRTSDVAPADRTKVYAIWDDFNSPSVDPAWTLSEIGGAEGTATTGAGALSLDAHTGDIWNNSDSFVYLWRDVSGDFEADTLVASFKTPLGPSSRLGGVMLRQSLTNGSPHISVSPFNGSAAVAAYYRYQENGLSFFDPIYGPNPVPEYVKLVRNGASLSALHSDNASDWEALPQPQTLAFIDPVKLGIPFANQQGGSGSVGVDWFRLRKRVEPPPSVDLDTEEGGPF